MFSAGSQECSRFEKCFSASSGNHESRDNLLTMKWYFGSKDSYFTAFCGLNNVVILHAVPGQMNGKVRLRKQRRTAWPNWSNLLVYKCLQIPNCCTGLLICGRVWKKAIARVISKTSTVLFEEKDLPSFCSGMNTETSENNPILYQASLRRR